MNGSGGLHFLIDYENVGESGMDGVEHLYDADTLEVFYSKCCEKISRKTIDFILKSGCEFQTYKLKKTGKNALDFYIVSRVGEMFGAGYTGKVVIVSKDKGYSAIKDYWSERGVPGNQILMNHSVKTGIMSSNENSVRRKQILRESEQVSIDGEYVIYAEKQRIKRNLEVLFQNTEYKDSLAQICELACRPEFVSNDFNRGKRVISSIEQELLNCDEFSISVAFITLGGITPLLQVLKELEENYARNIISEL